MIVSSLLLLSLLPHFASSSFHEIIKSLNKEVDPCDDFYKYVCPQSSRNSTGPSPQEVDPSEKEEDSLSTYFDKPLRDIRPKDRESGMWKPKYFYQQCMKDVDAEITSDNHYRMTSKLEETITYSAGYDFTDIIAELANVTGNLGWVTLKRNKDETKEFDYQISGPTRIFGNCTVDCDQWEESNANFISSELERYAPGLFEQLDALAYDILDFEAELQFEEDEFLPENDTLIVPIEQLQEVIPLAYWNVVFDRVLYLEDLPTSGYNASFSTSYFTKLISLIESKDEDLVKGYLLIKYISSQNIVVPSTQYEDYNEFWILNEYPEAEFETKMELCQNYTARSFGGNEILHRIVYEYHLSEEYLSKAKKFALKMNESVHRLIPQLPWLTDTVKAFALARADNLTFVIGNHSDFLPAGFNLKDWFDLFEFEEGDNAWEIQKMAAQFTAKLHMESVATLNLRTPVIIHNAYYLQNQNTIAVTPTYLYKSFSTRSSKMENYAKLGFTIGHEIGHGLYTAVNEALKNSRAARWWYEEFISGCLVNLYDSYYVSEAHKFVNGTLSLEENFADVFGLHLAYEAFHRSNQSAMWLNKKYTNDQLFFFAYAHGTCSNDQKESGFAHFHSNDEHAPSASRVNVPLSNYVPFAKAFNCPAKAPMVSQAKCRIFQDAVSPVNRLITLSLGVFFAITLISIVVAVCCCLSSRRGAKVGPPNDGSK